MKVKLYAAIAVVFVLLVSGVPHGGIVLDARVGNLADDDGSPAGSTEGDVTEADGAPGPVNEWPHPYQDNRYNMYVDDILYPPLMEDWSIDRSFNRPRHVVADGKVFVMNTGLEVVAFSYSDGSVIWERDLMSNVGGYYHFYNDDVLYLALNNPNAVIALEADTGDEIWTSYISARPNEAMMVYEDTVIVGTSSGLYWLDINDGTVVAKGVDRGYSGNTHGAFSWQGSVLYYADHGRTVHKVNLVTRLEMGRITGESPLVLANGRLYVGMSGDSAPIRAYSYDPVTLTRLEEVVLANWGPGATNELAPFAVSPDFVVTGVVSTSNNHVSTLTVLDAGDLHILKERHSVGYRYANPIIVGNVLFTTTSFLNTGQPALRLFDLPSLNLRAEIPIGDWGHLSFTDGALVCSHAEGVVKYDSLVEPPELSLEFAEVDSEFYKYGDAVNFRVSVKNTGSVDAKNLRINVDVADPDGNNIVEGTMLSGVDILRGQTHTSEWTILWTIPHDATNGKYWVTVGVWDTYCVRLYLLEFKIDFFYVADEVCNLDVPYFYQFSTSWCTLNSMSMILGYYGFNVQPLEIADVWDLDASDGVNIILEKYWNQAILKFFSNTGLKVEEPFIYGLYYDQTDWIKERILEGIPVMYSHDDKGPLPGSLPGHTVVLNGYVKIDEQEYFLVNDPSGLYVDNLWGADIHEPPYVDVPIKIETFETKGVLQGMLIETLHAIIGTPDPIPGTMSFPDKYYKPVNYQNSFATAPAIQFETESAIDDVTYYSYLNSGLQWRVLGDWTYSIDPIEEISVNQGSTMYLGFNVMNNIPYSADYYIAFSIRDESGDVLSARTNPILMKGFEFKPLDMVNPEGLIDVDLTGLPVGMYELTVEMYPVDDYSSRTSIQGIPFSIINPDAYAVQTISHLVEKMNLVRNIESPLLSKLDNAQKPLISENTETRNDAVNKLCALINYINAKRNKDISIADADRLIDAIQLVIDNLC